MNHNTMDSELSSAVNRVIMDALLRELHRLQLLDVQALGQQIAQHRCHVQQVLSQRACDADQPLLEQRLLAMAVAAEHLQGLAAP